MAWMKSSEEVDKVDREPDTRILVARCQADQAMMKDLRRIYSRADKAVSDSGAVCLGGGACCKFDLFDHRLYLSLAELAMLTTENPPDPGRARSGRCPYQVGPICIAYSRRPLGCRIFFCNRDFHHVQQGLYEEYHDQIRTLHQTRCMPYSYGELAHFLAQLLLG